MALAIAALPVPAKTVSPIETPASDSRITYIGRTLTEGGDVTFDWTGTYLRIAFEGDYLAIRASETGKSIFNLWVDRVPDAEADKIVTVTGADTLIVLYDAREGAARYGRKVPKTHTATLMKRTEGEGGKTTLHAFLTHGPLLQAEGVKGRVIEFVGDSYTCGYGSENSVATDRFTQATENQNKAYDAIIGRYFDADIIVVAHSGMGINRNYNDKLRGYTMPDRYRNVFDNGFDEVPDAPKWSPDMSPARPDVTVVFLGANDFSTSRQPSRAAFRKDYLRLLQAIKDNYGPDHPILCCASMNDPEIFEYVKSAALECGLPNVSYVGLVSGVHAADERGADYHPSYAAHRKVAHVFIPYIATLTGWPLEDRPIR